MWGGMEKAVGHSSDEIVLMSPDNVSWYALTKQGPLLEKDATMVQVKA